MAYNFPMTYQPVSSPQVMYPSMVSPVPAVPPVQMPQTSPQQNSSIVWVQGEAGAKAYPVAAGNSVLLLDSEDSVFYIKSTDSSGMPMPLRTFDFKERTGQIVESSAVQFNPNDYVSRKEFEELKKSISNRREKNYGKSTE